MTVRDGTTTTLTGLTTLTGYPGQGGQGGRADPTCSQIPLADRPLKVGFPPPFPRSSLPYPEPSVFRTAHAFA